MSSRNRNMHRPPDRLADRYVVQERIGEGASAITFRGWDERLERVVAIKILRQTLADDESYVRRFRQEARTAASVSHGNVVDVYDFGQEDGALYIVMQYVDGEDLKQLITRDAPLDPMRVRSIIGQVLGGLQAIHAAGIIHRDIKPENVLIGHDGQARVTDFGVAHVEEDSGLTVAGTTVGTAAYMAPEQAQGGRVSEATDLYAVGVMLYEMLTGYLPFNGPTSMATMLEHIQRDVVPPSQRLPGHGISTAMDSVVLQALAKQPERRFNSARAMRQAINHVFSGAGTQATVAAPVAQPTMHAGGAVAPPVRRRPSDQRSRPPAYAPEPMSATTFEERRPARDEGAGIKGAVRALLTLIVLGLFAVLAWFLFDNLQGDNQGGGTDPTATVEVTRTAEPTATDEPGVIAPMPTATEAATQTPEPTATLEPTPEPTQAPEPTATDEPTPEPTLEPEQPIIEPMEITPMPTESGQGNASDNGRRNAEKKKDKLREKKDKEDREDDGGAVFFDVSPIQPGGTS